MSDGMKSEAQLRLDFISNIDRLIDDLQRAGTAMGGLDRESKKLVNDVERAVGKATKATKSLGDQTEQTTDKSSKAWRDLVESIRTANDEYRAFRRDQLTGQDGPGKDVSAYSIDELRKYIATQDAANASFISAARQRVREAESIGEAIERSEAASAAAINRTTAAEQTAARERRNRARASASSEWDGQFGDLSTRAAQRTQMADEAVRAEARMEAATNRRARAEQDLQRARTAARRSSDSREWDAEFNALTRATTATDAHAASLPRLRYALYDVATTANITAIAIAGVGTAATVAFAKYESAFTNVERTLEPGTIAASELRKELVELSNSMPVSFTDLSAIATLGNQLGVGADEIARFTELVAKFSTVSGMTAEASAQAFGRLSNILGIPISDADRLASAIELVGVRSAATDQEIIGLTERLGASATRAGFTADQVVGLAGALGSLGVAPERAQGVFETYFNSLNESLSEGGKKMEAFAAVTGRSADDLNAAVRSGGGFAVFQDFIKGLQGADTVQLSGALDTLGLSGLRANEVIGRISQRMPLLQKSFDTAAQGARENTELNRQYALVLDDLASRWQIFLNKLSTFAATVGAQIGPAIVSIIDLIGNLLQGLTDFASSPIGGVIVRIVAGMGAMVAVLAGVVGAAALAGASMLALRTAMAEITIIARGGGLGPWIAGLLGVETAGNRAAASTGRFASALQAVGKATVVLALISAAIALFTDFGGTIQGFGDAYINSIGFWIQATQNFVNFLDDALSRIPLIGGALKAQFKTIAVGLGAANAFGLDKVRKEFDAWTQTLPRAKNEVAGLGGEASKFSDILNGIDGPGAFGGVGDGAAAAAAKVRTLVDYANDLSGVMGRAFDIRFGGDKALDTITSGWLKVASSIDDARTSVSEYLAKIQGLNSDKSTLQYWLSIAEMYGDEKRAAAIRAELANLNVDLAKSQKELAKAQDKASGTLVGNSEAAIENRASILGLVGDYQSYITALASSGIGQQDLAQRVAVLKEQFLQQATQMGFNRTEVDKYAIAFDGMKVAIDNVPRNITVSFNADPALQALAEFAARAAADAAGAGTSAGNNWANSFSNAVNPALEGLGAKMAAIARASAIAKAMTDVAKAVLTGGSTGNGRAGGGGGGGGGGGYWSGGYTGSGSKYAVAGPVHKDEFVFSKEATNHFGVGFLNRMHEAGKAGKNMAPAGLAAAPGFTELGPASINALAQALYVRMEMNGRLVAEGVSDQFASANRFGEN